MKKITFKGTFKEIENLKTLVSLTGESKLPKIDSEDSIYSSLLFTASVVSYNCFEDIKNELHLGEMATHEWIKDFTIEFEEEHSSISEWESYLDSLDEDYCDWEVYLISKVEERVSQRML